PVVTAGEQVASRPAVAALAVIGSANPTGAQLATSFPPRRVASSWPATEATRSEVLARVLSAPFALDNRLSQQTRRLGVLAVLGWLRARSGESWQQRWRASGAGEAGVRAERRGEPPECAPAGRIRRPEPAAAPEPRAAGADLRRCDPTQSGL